MKHQLSTIAVLALIAVPVSACGSTTHPAPEQPVTVADQSENRIYETDLVAQALAAPKSRVYESDLVAKALAATKNRVYESDLVSKALAATQ
jgi:hypothetical protein